MFIVFAAPFVNPSTIRFLERVRDLPDVRVGVVCQEPEDFLPFPVDAHWRVQDALDADQLEWAVRGLGRVDRLLAINEQIQVPAGEVRDRLGLPGMDAETARNFRDKARMKERFRAAGVPCARWCKASDEAEAWRFVEGNGLPVCVKPVDGAAAQSTYRVSTREAFADVLHASHPRPDRPLQVEEFIVGEEHSFDSVSLNGQHLWHSTTRYMPTPLDVMRNPWVQWRILLPREVCTEIVPVGRQALDALGMGTGVSHMEWFRRADGSLAVGEVGGRPPGAQIVTLMNRAHDMDLYGAWARLMVYGEFTPPPERAYAAGVAFLRGLGSGRVKAVHGLHEVLAELGDMVTDYLEPQVGQVSSITYEGEGYVIVRHPATARVEEALDRIVRTVRVELVT